MGERIEREKVEDVSMDSDANREKNQEVIPLIDPLDKINSEEFHLIVAPLKLKNATGSPVRAMALVD